MSFFFHLSNLSGILVSAGLLLSSPVARAQMAVPAGAVAARGYDFMTVTTVEAGKSLSLILFSTEFQGKTEIALQDVNVLGVEKFKERIRQNTQLVNEQLSALTVAGWELVQVYTPTSPTSARCYLFRKAKN